MMKILIYKAKDLLVILFITLVLIILDSAAAFPTTMYFNGNDAITLEFYQSSIIDIIGKVGSDLSIMD